MLNKSIAVLYLVVAACLVAPSSGSEDPTFQLFDAIPKDSSMGNTVDRYRRAPADGVSEGAECMKNGRKGICVLYFQCDDAPSADDPHDDEGSAQCANYLQTCCMSKVVDLVSLVDIQ